jgi:hypothetical protein
MNRTLKEATVKKYYYQTHQHLKEHIHASLLAYKKLSEKGMQRSQMCTLSGWNRALIRQI